VVFRRILLFVFASLVALLAYEWLTFPDVSKLATEAPKTTAFMELRKEELRAAGKNDAISHRFVPYAQISPYLRRGVLVAEDDSFYQHDAIDTKAMKEAIEKNWKRKKITHGGSTITQQLAKNLYLSPSRNPMRKVKEYFIARALERHLTKKRILELYLNVVEMGERVYGAEAASQFYFHRPASDLTPPQAALLAGCLPNPRLMNPGTPSKRLRWRQQMVLARLRRWGYFLETEVLTEKKPEEAPAPPQTDTVMAPEPSTETTAAPEPTNTDTRSTEIPQADTPAPPPETTSRPPAPTQT
jgi:monofunctional glycosyltransferase